MSENICPLCGKESQDEEVFCRDCQEIAQNSYPSELLSSDNSAENQISRIVDENQEDEPLADMSQPEETSVEEGSVNDAVDEPQNKGFYQNNKKSIIFIAVGIVLLLILGALGSYVFVQDKKAEEAEIAYWDSRVEENTPLAYSKYLVRYPNGQFSEAAQSKIIALREKERKEWEALRKSSDINAFYAFLTDYPNTPYGSEIKLLTDSLSWLSAVKENTAACYLAYLENVKLGNLAGEYQALAQEKYDYLSQLKTVEGNDLIAVKKVLKDFFKLLSSGKYKQLHEEMAPVMIRFYDVENQSKDDVTNAITAHLKSRKIKNISYNINTDGLDVIQDNKGIYFVTLPVNMEVRYSDKKKKKEGLKQVLNIELNDKKQIQSLSEKGK